MNPYLIAVLAALIADFALGALADWLNVRNLRFDLPEEFQGFYDPAGYVRSQEYLRDKTRFSLAADSGETALLLAAILSGAFGWADSLARFAGQGEILSGLAFAGLLLLAWDLLRIPLSAYDTFVLEERYGFNKTSPRTFVLDILKAWLLAAVLGGPIFAGAIWFFEHLGARAWLYCWAALAAVQLVLAFAAPALIMPLFNKFTPLPEGALKDALEAYARSQGFRMKGIFVMDGSRRSGKSNAFFAGFGRLRRLVLLDTLLAKHTVPELVAVTAHELGHCRQGHVIKSVLLSLAAAGLELFLLSFFIRSQALAQAFGLAEVRVYAGLIFFGLLFAPISLVLSIGSHALSRRWEFAADAFARRTADGEALAAALKKLSVDNLSNLTPHPLKVLLDYGHPPILERLAALRPALTNPGASPKLL